jgi:hypothetical protein
MKSWSGHNPILLLRDLVPARDPFWAGNCHGRPAKDVNGHTE